MPTKVLDFDVGLTDPENPLTEHERMLASLTMGTNAALVQFVLEGIIPVQEQLHFMMHIMDFVGKLYAGKDLQLPGSTQTMRLNSQAGRLYADAAKDALTNGEANAAKMREAIKAAVLRAQEGQEQTNNLESEDDFNPEEPTNVRRKTLH